MDCSSDAIACSPVERELHLDSGVAMSTDGLCEVDQVLDSDSEEHLAELAEEQESSYWSRLDKVDVSEVEQSRLLPGEAHPTQDANETSPTSPQHVTRGKIIEQTSRNALLSSSPDPMDFLTGIQDEPRISHAVKNVTSTEEMPAHIQEDSAELSGLPVPGSQMEKLTTLSVAGPIIDVASDEEELPSLSQIFAASTNRLDHDKPSPPLQSAMIDSEDEEEDCTNVVAKAPSPLPRRLASGSPAAATSSSESGASPEEHLARMAPANPSLPPSTPPDLPPEEPAPPVRHFRKRTAAQLNPYQAEFAKYVMVAKQNQWEGIIIPAGLNLQKEKEETPEEKAARLAKRKQKKVDTQGGWLALDEGEGLPLASSEASSNTGIKQNRIRQTYSGSESFDASSSSPNRSDRSPRTTTGGQTKASAKGKERAIDEDTSDSDLPDIEIGFARSIKVNKDNHRGKKKRRHLLPDVNVYSHASTSHVTLEEALAAMKDKDASKWQRKSRHGHVEDAHRSGSVRRKHLQTRAESAPPSSSSPPRGQSRNNVRSLTSSPQPEKRSGAKRRLLGNSMTTGAAQSGDVIDVTSSPPRKRKLRRRNDVEGPEAREQQDSSDEEADMQEETSSDEEVAKEGDSPDRPFYRDDRFQLKGARKKAAFSTMPAIFMKRAVADLKLMREEKRTGGEVREVLPESGASGSEAENDPARARVRINKRNANKPIRFLIEESTSESDEGMDVVVDSEEERDVEATAVWANTSISSRNSGDKTPVQSKKGKRYWDGVIGRILLRDKLDRQAGASDSAPRKRKRRKRKAPMSKVSYATSSSHQANNSSKKGPARQRGMDRFKMYTPAVHLDDEDALFAALPAAPVVPPIRRGDGMPFRRSAVPVAPAVHCTLNAPADQTQGEEVWEGSGSTFSRFSFDFDIQLLPPGLSFTPDTYIGKGRLYDLVALAKGDADKGPSPIYACAPYGIQLDSDMAPDVLLNLLPRLCESAYDDFVTTSQVVRLTSSAGDLLHFCSMYMHDCKSDIAARSVVQAKIMEEMSRVETRLDSWVIQGDLTDTTKRMQMTLTFKWYMLEVAYRAYMQGTREELSDAAVEGSQEQLLDRLGELTQCLITIGFGKTVKNLKTLAAARNEHAAKLDDSLGELWICLLHLSSVGDHHDSHKFFSHATIWELVTTHLHADAASRRLHPVLAGEVASYSAMALCLLSQFNMHGLSTSAPRLSAHWLLLSPIVDQIKAQDFAKAYANMSSTSLTRTGRYIWTIFARCLTMATRWNWPVLDQTRLIGKLFDIVNARELHDFHVDGEADFPRFLADFTGTIPTDIASDDTVFRLLLRLLGQAYSEAEAKPTKKNKDLLSRLAMRVMPMRQRLPFSRQAALTEARKHRSVLLNHFSLFILLAAIDPQASERRFPRFKAILDFQDADTKARQECLRAILYLGIVYRVKGIDIAAVLTWLGEIADYIGTQYTSFARQRTQLQLPLRDRTNVNTTAQANQTPAHAKKQTMLERQLQLGRVDRDMSEVAVLQGLLLGSVRQLMLAKTTSAHQARPSYPSIAFLSSSWTKNVLGSPMALDPVVGSQILQCLRSFLDLRRQALPAKKTATQSESQDEYGDFDFDYDDPALNDLLGINGEPEAVKRPAQEDTKALDNAFAEMIKIDISPAIYHLLSNITAAKLSQNTGVPDMQDREGYISDLVEVWTECAAVLVENDMRDWSYYISEFGKESWQRVSDMSARYEIALHFVTGMLELDERSYKPYRDQALDVLFRSLVANALKAKTSQLLSTVLNIDPACYLWRNHPFTRDALTGDYELDEPALLRHREQLLRGLFRNSKDVLGRRFAKPAEALNEGLGSIADVLTAQKLDKNLMYRLFGSMLSAMRDQLDALRSPASIGAAAAKYEAYALFCKGVVNSLKEEIGPYFANETAIPQLRLLAGVMGPPAVTIVL